MSDDSKGISGIAGTKCNIGMDPGQEGVDGIEACEGAYDPNADASLDLLVAEQWNNVASRRTGDPTPDLTTRTPVPTQHTNFVVGVKSNDGRLLSPEEQAAMARVRLLEKNFLAELQSIKYLLALDPNLTENGQGYRWLSMATTSVELASMEAIRAITRPKTNV